MKLSPVVLRTFIITALILFVEATCRFGFVPRFTLIPPSEMVTGLISLLASGKMNLDLYSTLRAVVISLVTSVTVGTGIAVILDRVRRLRRGLEPFFATYYSIPTYVFYPLFIVMFGLTDTPKIVIGFMFSVVAVAMAVLTGLDRVPRVLRKTAKVHHLSTMATAFRLIIPFAAPYLLSGIKLAVSYSLIGVVGSEFILANAGVGYRTAFAYNNFDSQTMYSLILFVLLVSIIANTGLFMWETALLRKRGLK